VGDFDMTRITAGKHPHFAGKLRGFGLQNGVLRIADDLLGPLPQWRTVGDGGFVVEELTSPDFDTLFVLSADKELWRGDFLETWCEDGEDNDGDGFPDELDDDCFAPLGEKFCAEQDEDGTFCFSRFNGNDWVLAHCADQTLLGTQTGTVAHCVQDVPGSDWLPVK
jgi:hypothetical protein